MYWDHYNNSQYIFFIPYPHFGHKSKTCLLSHFWVTEILNNFGTKFPWFTKYQNILHLNCTLFWWKEFLILLNKYFLVFLKYFQRVKGDIFWASVPVCYPKIMYDFFDRTRFFDFNRLRIEMNSLKTHFWSAIIHQVSCSMRSQNHCLTLVKVRRNWSKLKRDSKWKLTKL